MKAADITQLYLIVRSPDSLPLSLKIEGCELLVASVLNPHLPGSSLSFWIIIICIRILAPCGDYKVLEDRDSIYSCIHHGILCSSLHKQVLSIYSMHKWSATSPGNLNFWNLHPPPHRLQNFDLENVSLKSLGKVNQNLNLPCHFLYTVQCNYSSGSIKVSGTFARMYYFKM